MKDSGPKVTLLKYTPDGEELVTMAAKLCYSDATLEELKEKVSDEKEVRRFLDMLDSISHDSPQEHSVYTFGIENVSRITEIQLVRKRIASYSIKSGRYVKRDNPNFVMPPSIEESRLASEAFEKVRTASIEAYNEIFLILMLRQMGYTDDVIETLSTESRIEAVAFMNQIDKKHYKVLEKRAIEDARYAHLQSLSTTIIVTMNASSLKGFFKARCCRRAQWEIHDMAMLMLEEVRKVSPNLFRRAGAGCVRGKCTEGKMACGNPFPLIGKERTEDA